MQLKQGFLLQGGKYRIEKVLGQGGFGITYLAIQIGLDREVAIKEFFMKELCERDASTSYVTLGTESSRTTVNRFREKFLKEARHIAKLNHPHIVRIIDVFEENGTAYYVMEYAGNGSLSDMVEKLGNLSEPVAIHYILQVADALDYIHKQKMNHLDVKPANIMINEKDEALLIDFGLSKQYDSTTGNQTSTTPVGISHGYAPLEQYKEGGVQEFSPEADIYALGATFFKLLTGITPPNASDVNEDGVPVDLLKAKGVSQRAMAVICQAMEGRKRDRMKDVNSFIDNLKGQSSDDDEKTHMDNRDGSAKERKSPPWKWICSIFAVITIAAIAFFIPDNSQDEFVSDTISGEIKGHEFVDLGLSVKWATKNVGASLPSDYGDYFAWGETTPESSCTTDNSKTYEKDMSDIAGNSQYDAARANWGSTWRLPTKAECEELIEKCDWKWTSQDGHNGYRVTSKMNGNSIFLPAAGSRYGTKLSGVKSYGYYWTSTLAESDIYEFYEFYFDWTEPYVTGLCSSGGHSVRPVSD